MRFEDKDDHAFGNSNLNLFLFNTVIHIILIDIPYWIFA